MVRSGQEHGERDRRARLDRCVTCLDFDVCERPSRGVGLIFAKDYNEMRAGQYASGLSARTGTTKSHIKHWIKN